MRKRPAERRSSRGPGSPALWRHLRRRQGNLRRTAPSRGVDPHFLAEKTLAVEGLLGELTKVKVEQIDAREPLEGYGIDSIMIMELNRQLGKVFGGLSKTLFSSIRRFQMWRGIWQRSMALPAPSGQGWMSSSNRRRRQSRPTANGRWRGPSARRCVGGLVLPAGSASLSRSSGSVAATRCAKSGGIFREES